MPYLIGAIVVILLLLVLGVVMPYNKLVRQRNTIQESWRQVDVELNRRYELIPNLVETVRAYAAHERNTLESIVQLRTQAMQAGDPGQKAQANDALSGQLQRLMVNVEAYPELRSNQNFVELQRQLVDTEDRIAAGRRYYNANVREYNTAVESFPSSLIANSFNFQKATYFEVNDAAVRQAPDVNFGEISYRGDQPASAPTTFQPGVDQLPASGPTNALPNPQSTEYQQAHQPINWQVQQPAPTDPFANATQPQQQPRG